jgi:hypothetical protein
MHRHNNRPGLERKHFAIAKVKKMRDLNLLPPKSNIPKNFRQQNINLKVEIIDFSHVNTRDQQLSDDHNDSMMFDLISFLMSNNLFEAAHLCLEFVKNTTSQRYLLHLAKIRVKQGKYRDATNALDLMLQ